MERETITITKKEYEKLKDDSKWLSCLEAAGVDNWEGYDFARELLDDDDDDDDDEKEEQ